MDLSRQLPTLDNVAKAAGVSTATVSRFFNNPDMVAEATAQRIRAAVAKTGYIPNLMAGSLAMQRSRLVALLIPSFVNSLFEMTIEGMISQLSADGNVVMLGLTGMSADRTEELIKVALGRRADAIILPGEVNAATRQALLRSKTSVIEIWGLPENPIDMAIGFSHPSAGRHIARFLRGRGYNNLHVVASNTTRSMQRHDALMEEWIKLGGPAPSDDIVDGPLHFGQARAAFARLRRLKKRPDVVVCGSDRLAQGMIIEAHSAGMKVPDDLAVMGFGNSDLAGEMRPTITSVDIDGALIAREASALLKLRAEQKEISSRIIDIGFRLIARESA